MAGDEKPTLVERIEPIAHDLERLVDLHAELLRSELRQSAASATPALASVGAGAGLAAAAGLMGSLALVHALQRSTRLPLWGCYALVGGVLGGAGAALMGSGVRRLAATSFVPRETLATLREDYEWVRGITT